MALNWGEGIGLSDRPTIHSRGLVLLKNTAVESGAPVEMLRSVSLG